MMSPSAITFIVVLCFVLLFIFKLVSSGMITDFLKQLKEVKDLKNDLQNKPKKEESKSTKKKE